VGSAPFVGRASEIGALDEALARTRAGHGGLMLVSGEPGIGKTRLADEVSDRARAQDMRVLWGRAWERGGAPPFWPWVQALRALVAEVGADGVMSRLGDRGRELVRILPELGDRLPPAPRPGKIDAERARFLLFDAATDLFRVVAEARPTVVVLDDLHSADQASLRLLLFVARMRPVTRLLVLALLRQWEMRSTPATADLFAEIVREGRMLVLRGLGEVEVAALARGRAGRALAPEMVRAIHEATGGNPLFVDELVRLVLVERADADRPSPLPIPDGVRDAIRRRCAPLGAEVQSVLRLAAVLGGEFDLAALGALAAIPSERLLELLEDAIDLGLIGRVAAHTGRFRFAHVLVRDALYEHLRPAERARHHREAGEALERLYADRLEPHLAAVVHHYLAAAGPDDVARAAGYARRAAEHALAQLAPEEAILHADRALHALDTHGAPEAERLPLLLVLGEAHRRGGDSARARVAFRDAAAGARRLASPELMARAALGYGHSRPTESGAADRTLLALLQDALDSIGAADAPLRAHLLGRLGEELYFTEERARGAELAGQAVEMARRLGREDVLATALVRRYFTIWGPDTADEGLALSGEATRLAARLGLRAVELVATSWYVNDLLQHGDAPAADRAIAAYGEVAESLRLPEFRWRVRLLRATRALMRGEFDQAAALAGEAAAIEDGQHGSTAFQFFAVQRVALALEGGRPGALEDVVETMHGLAERYPMLPVWRAAFARVCAELGRVEEARRDLEVLAADGFQGIRRDGNWLTTMMNASETAVLLGDADRAAVLHRQLEPYARLHVAVAHCACFGSVERYLGRLAATQDRPKVAAAHFARAESADGRTGAAPFVAQTRASWAELLIGRGGDRERAHTLRDAALATARALGIARLVDRLERLDAPASARQSQTRDTRPAAWVFRLEGEYWTIGSGDQVARLRDTRGLRYLHRLIANPRRAFPATELVGSGAPGGHPGPGNPIENPGTLLDTRSRNEYANRLAELRSALEEASAHHDLGRIAPLEAEIDWLKTTLAAAVGLGARFRRAGSTAERARTAVTKVIRGAVRRIKAESPALGHHLSRSVRTGLLCVYEPDPTHPVSWEL
jgi:hypothetical protein